MAQQKPKARRKKWQKDFIEALRKHGVVTTAAAIAKVNDTYVYQARKEDPRFAEQWEQAMNGFFGQYVLIGHMGAMTGKLRRAGRPDAEDEEEQKDAYDNLTIQQRLDLIKFFMSRAPGFREADVKVEHTGKGGEPLPPPTNNTLVITVDPETAKTLFPGQKFLPSDPSGNGYHGNGTNNGSG